MVSDTVSLPVGSPLGALADRSPTLVVFLRHFGCAFCREAISDVARSRDAIRKAGVALAFVHTAPPADAEPWFHDPALADALLLSDPTLDHYRAFGLGRTNSRALVDPKLWARGARCAMLHGFGLQPADLMRQLPGRICRAPRPGARRLPPFITLRSSRLRCLGT